MTMKVGGFNLTWFWEQYLTTKSLTVGFQDGRGGLDRIVDCLMSAREGDVVLGMAEGLPAPVKSVAVYLKRHDSGYLLRAVITPHEGTVLRLQHARAYRGLLKKLVAQGAMVNTDNPASSCPVSLVWAVPEAREDAKELVMELAKAVEVTVNSAYGGAGVIPERHLKLVLAAPAYSATR